MLCTSPMDVPNSINLVKKLNVTHLGHELDIAEDYHYHLVLIGNSIAVVDFGFVELDVNIIIAVAKNIHQSLQGLVDRNLPVAIVDLDLLFAQGVSLVILIIGLLDFIANTTG